MQYALLIYLKPGYLEELGEEERQAVSDDYWALRSNPHVVGGAGLQPVETATTVRMEHGETAVTDGPFAETKEVFGGYYLVAADDLDTAIEIAERIPAVRLGGAVEIRPVMV